MAEIVAAFALPHTPSFVATVAKDGPDSPIAKLYKNIKNYLDAAKPDVIVKFDSDHWNTFFYDSWPTFAVGISKQTEGPSDQTPGMPWYKVPVNETLAQHIQNFGVENNFDLSSAAEFTIDHSILVPLHFLTPEMKTPIVPIFINTFVAPLPNARRCHELGQMVRNAIESYPKNLKVAMMASGSLSLEVGAPRMEEGKTFGVPDKEWAKHVLDCFANGKIEQLIKESTKEQMAKAGNIGGEILNWIALAGSIGVKKPCYVDSQPELGNAFAVWELK
jgi:protocatechuate 4,5-dioxygenase beta chain